jgi:hydroxymethylpyrimidine/phosphomethylpyrimidine kinase
MPSVALTIAGSDPSGGAGIQADLKTFHQMNVYGAAAITLITVQNTLRVERVEVLDPELVVAQVNAVISDIPPAAVKTGALGNRAVVEAVARVAESLTVPLVVDPVMISKHGSALLDDAAIEVVREVLLRRAFLVMPNLAEAETLTGVGVKTVDGMKKAAEALATLGAKNVLVKGGHLEGEESVDVLFAGGEMHEFRDSRVDTVHTHGTGCTFSAAVTAGLARGFDLVEAVGVAKHYVTEAIRTAPGLGGGVGPVNHFA